MSNTPNGNFAKFLAGKGFYAVLAVCLVGAGTAAWIAVDRTVDSIEENNNNIVNEHKNSQSQNEEWDFPPAEETEKPQTNIEVSQEPSSSAPKSSSSQEAYSPPVKQSEEPVQSTDSQILSYVMPIDGEIINPYSGDKLIKDVTLNEWRTHNGIDIKAPQGTDVVAVADGVVSDIYNDKVWGMVIEISHADGNVSVYAGVMPEAEIEKGAEVSMSDKIGVTDKVPGEIALDPHLHFAIKVDGVEVDPLLAMGKK